MSEPTPDPSPAGSAPLVAPGAPMAPAQPGAPAEQVPLVAPGAQVAPAPPRGLLAETLPLFGRVPLAVWRGRTVEALDLVRRGSSLTWFVVIASVAAVWGVAALLTVAVAGGSFGTALQAFAAALIFVLGFYMLRCVTVWWALRIRRSDIAFPAASSLVATVATVHGLVAAVGLVLGVLPGVAGGLIRLIILGPLFLVAVMVSEPLLYVGMAREAGQGPSILMPYVWFNLVFAALLGVIGLLTTLMGLAAIWDALT